MSVVPTLLSVEGLSKSYGGVHAVRSVSFELRAGEILALIGPNGAGKSTCFDMLNGQKVPDSGRINLLGEDTAGKQPRDIWRLGVGRTFQITATFPTMTVRENIQVALAYGDASVAPPTMVELLDEYRLKEVANRPAADLNSAQQKMLDLTRALATRPRLLLLDELAAGLNPAELDWIAGRIKALAATGMAVIVVEHLMGFIEQITDRVIVLNAGKEIFEGKLAAAVREPQVIEVFLGGEHAA
jgi:branched-chain amino acid transport system ATP-binding protein